MEENKIITRKDLKKEFNGTYLAQAMVKPFKNRKCLLCDKQFPPKSKIKKDGLGVRYIICSKCGLTHYNALNYPELLLVSPIDEEKYRGLLTFQKQKLIYASDEALEFYNKSIDMVAIEDEVIKSDKSSKLILTFLGESPIYGGKL